MPPLLSGISLVCTITIFHMPHSDTNNTTAHDFSESTTLEESIKSEAKRLGFLPVASLRPVPSMSPPSSMCAHG